MSNAHPSTGLQNSYKYHKNYIYSTINNNLYDLTQVKRWSDSTFIKLTSFYLQHNFGHEEPTQI